MTVLMDEMSSAQLAAFPKERAFVIWPVGALEEHGPHLPLGTDTFQPEHIARLVAERTGSLVAPALNFGHLQSTLPFPGSVSLRFDTLRAVALDVLSGLADNGFRLIMVLSGHAGRAHMAALNLAALDVVRSRDVRIWVLSDYDIAYRSLGTLFPKGDGHAGALETSRIMAIRPELVGDLPGPQTPDFPEFEVLANPHDRFPGGYHGDPRKADAKKGEKVDEIIAKELAALIESAKKDGRRTRGARPRRA